MKWQDNVRRDMQELGEDGDWMRVAADWDRHVVAVKDLHGLESEE